MKTYTVKKGDTLYGISKMFNTTVDELKKLNNLNTNTLSIGQQLVIPRNENEITYIVKVGDTLYSIARKYNVTIDELINLNNLSTTSFLSAIGLPDLYSACFTIISKATFRSRAA